MRQVLPSPLWNISRASVAAFLGALVGMLACASRQPPPGPPGPPIVADPSVSLRGMVEECDAMVEALTTFKTCPNLDEADRSDLDDWIERAGKDFAAGRKAKPEPNAQAAIAMACLRATRSVEAATERCHAGPKPKNGWYLRRR